MNEGPASGGTPEPRQLPEQRMAQAIVGPLEVAQRQCGLAPAIETQRGTAFQSRMQERFIGRHVPGAGMSVEGKQPARQLRHLRIGSLAALTSSGRLTPSVWGASWRKSGSSSRMASMASAKES